MAEQAGEELHAEAWYGVMDVLSQVDPVAHRNEPTDLTPVARLVDTAVELNEATVSVRLVYRAIATPRSATVVLTFATLELVADRAAGGWAQGEATMSGLIADAAFEVWEVIEHTMWWDGPEDGVYAWP